MEVADRFRPTMRLKKTDKPRIWCFKTLLETIQAMEERQTDLEYVAILRKLLDMHGRLRCTAGVAGDFVKVYSSVFFLRFPFHFCSFSFFFLCTFCLLCFSIFAFLFVFLVLIFAFSFLLFIIIVTLSPLSFSSFLSFSYSSFSRLLSHGSRESADWLYWWAFVAFVFRG